MKIEFKPILSLFILMISFQVLAKLNNTVVIQGVLRGDQFMDSKKGYVLYEDSFQQKFLWPTEYLKKELKIDIKRSPAAVFFEVDVKKYQEIHEDCVKKFSKHPMKKNCPVNLKK